MKKTYNLLLLLLLTSCNGQIKSDNKVDDEVISPTPDKVENKETKKNTGNTNITVENDADLIGSWVGWFESDMGDENGEMLGGIVYWNRENKITISIDEIEGGLVKGHTIVAGNKRDFNGTITRKESMFTMKLDEPGDDKYDGSFQIEMNSNKKLLTGKWKAYKNIEINKRKFNLSKKIFKYNPNQQLESQGLYADWNKLKDEEGFDYNDDGIIDEIQTSFSSATEIIYSLNASSQLLVKKDVENLKKGDLIIIRNTIFARHGYSFKKRPLRLFFDAQDWYMPLDTDVAADLTEIEKKNIQLLLKYEKNAAEYYDYFGR